jgi:hypothetical protein
VRPSPDCPSGHLKDRAHQYTLELIRHAEAEAVRGAAQTHHVTQPAMANGASTDTAQLLERSAQWDRPPRSMVVSSPVSHTRVGSRVTFDSLPTSPSPVAAAPTVSPLLAPATPTSPPLLVAVAAASLSEPSACESPTILKHDKVEIRVGGEDVVVRLPSRSPQVHTHTRVPSTKLPIARLPCTQRFGRCQRGRCCDTARGPCERIALGYARKTLGA